jgi:hypothetical protein
VEVVALGVLVEALMSVLVPGVVAVPDVPAPIEVPLPVVEPVELVVLPELMSVVLPVVLPVVVPLVLEPVPPAVLLLPVSLGIVVEGEVLVEPVVPASSFLPQALRDRAAMRARAAHCAIGDLIIRTLLVGVVSMWIERGLTAIGCLRLTLVTRAGGHVVCYCRRL